LAELDPVQIFVGKPALLSGKEGAATDKALQFADLLRGITGVEIVMVDERLSTVTAARNLRDSGKTARESKASIDMAAAVGILEFAIELEKRK
jgi:putative Holliday junction resolvase